MLGENAELGPLDAQVLDTEREAFLSALDEVQALERLQTFGMEAMDRFMFMMVMRSKKKIETLLPEARKFVTAMMEPLLEKIDTVHYTQMSRTLKVAEEYAARLLQDRLGAEKGQALARHLVEKYPEHGFVIDVDEVKAIGLNPVSPSVEQDAIMKQIVRNLGGPNIIGRLKECPTP